MQDESAKAKITQYSSKRVHCGCCECDCDNCIIIIFSRQWRLREQKGVCVCVCVWVCVCMTSHSSSNLIYQPLISNITMQSLLCHKNSEDNISSNNQHDFAYIYNCKTINNLFYYSLSSPVTTFPPPLHGYYVPY